MLNHLPTATFFMIPLFFNSMGYDYKEISQLRVSIDINTIIHITTGSSARDDGTAGEFTVIGETICKQFPVPIIHRSFMPCRNLLHTPFPQPYPSNPSFSCRSPCSSVFLGQARLNRRNPSPSLPKTYPMSSHRWQS